MFKIQGKIEKTRSPIGLIILLIIVLIPVGLWYVATTYPVRLGMLHEQVMGLLYGGVTPAQEGESVDRCQPFPQRQQINVEDAVIVQENGNQIPVQSGVVINNATTFKDIRHTTRSVQFGNGAALSIKYSAPPATNPNCP